MDNAPLPAQQDQTALLLQQDQHQYDLARLNIEKNLENNALWAKHWLHMRLMMLIFIAVILVAILIFCGIAMYFDHADIAIRIIEGIVIFAAGNGTGFAIKTRLDSVKNQQQN